MTANVLPQTEMEQLMARLRERFPPPSEEELYPESDGVRVGESWWHAVLLAYLLDILRQRFAAAPDVFVACDMMLYYVQDSPDHKVAPDIMVVRGVENRPRSSFRLWQEATPCCIIEVISPRTRIDDLGTKRGLYAMLKVPEYFVFDPSGEIIDPPLIRFSLDTDSDDTDYRRQEGHAVESVELGMRFAFQDGPIRAYDTATGAPLLDYVEERRAREEEQRAREEERRARAAAETEVERLRAELRRLRPQGS